MFHLLMTKDIWGGSILNKMMILSYNCLKLLIIISNQGYTWIIFQNNIKCIIVKKGLIVIGLMSIGINIMTKIINL